MQQAVHPAVAAANKSSDYVVYFVTIGVSFFGVLTIFLLGLLFAALADQTIVDQDSGLPPLLSYVVENAMLFFVAIVVFVVVLVSVRMMRQ